MPIEYSDFEATREANGLRMVYVPGVPSPWGEAAKGILHVKGIDYTATRLDGRNTELLAWAQSTSAPIAVYEGERPRSGWAEILLLAERLAPEPRLIPADAEQRALLFGLSHEICGEMGLGWCRRLQSVAQGLEGRPGFPKPVAGYLGDKYGYREGIGPEVEQRVVDVLGMLETRLAAQHQAGSDYYLGDALSALDIYSAAFMALLAPLPPDQCPMPEALREAFGASGERVRAALDPTLLAHRDRIYQKHLELPLSL